MSIPFRVYLVAICDTLLGVGKGKKRLLREPVARRQESFWIPWNSYCQRVTSLKVAMDNALVLCEVTARPARMDVLLKVMAVEPIRVQVEPSVL